MSPASSPLIARGSLRSTSRAHTDRASGCARLAAAKHAATGAHRVPRGRGLTGGGAAATWLCFLALLWPSGLSAQAELTAVDPAAAAALQPLRTAITLQPGQTCLQEAQLESRTARWLERDQIDGRIHIVVRGGDAPQAVAFTVQRGAAPPAERRLQDLPDDCDQLHAAVALSIALAIDATLAEVPKSPPSPPVVAAPDPPPAVAAPPVVAPPPGPRADGRPRLRVDAAAGLSSGLVVGLAPAVTARVGFSPRDWIEARAGLLATSTGGLGFSDVSGSYAAWIAAGRAEVCARAPAHERVDLGVCMGAELGAFVTRGSDGLPGGGVRATSPWVAILAGVSGEVSLWGPVGLGLSVELHAPFQERFIELRNADGSVGATERVDPVGVCILLGPYYRADLD